MLNYKYTTMKRILSLLVFIWIIGQISFAQSIKFAIISDIHPDIMHDGEKRLQDFLDAASKSKVDFIIDLGDFSQVKPENQRMVDLWNNFSGDKYHVIGNHDADNCTKEEFMKFVTMPSRYYSFDKGNFHFIVLDPNNLYTDGKYIPYSHGNFYVDKSQRAHIDPEQLEWLKNDVEKTKKRCILFSHQCLENTVSNREKVRALLEAENKRAGFKKIVVAFSGHDHTNYEREINGITYIQINSASNQWVGDDYVCESRFDEQTNKEHPSLKYVVPWEKSIYAIVKVDDKGLQLKGKTSRFIAPTPEEMKIADSFFPFPLVPWIKDYSFKF